MNAEVFPGQQLQNGLNQKLFVSMSCLARGRFKEVCERPNGSCQEFCIETEIQAGRCLNGRPCCLPLGNQPQIDLTTPKED